MATALQQQLAAINAKSTDQLNLKAQKARHSQSLLYEPREAASQSFDTLFQICQEGFAELCQLDRRYASFAQNLFAESSTAVEREQMTAAENKELDAVIEQFLSLVSGKLLLRPAQKSAEWLVRRWRIHEYNTSTMLYAFLPYHGHDIFATVMSILPKQLPTAFTFLRPYIASLQCPPRHALVSVAVSNSTFLTNFSLFVLSASKRRLQSSLLVGSWASLLAQSLNARLDSAQSGRDEVRRQRSEDVLLSVLPTLQEMLAIKDAPDLFLAACMIMIILATKIELEEKVLDAMIESIKQSWTPETMRDGTKCIEVLARESGRTIDIPKIADTTLVNVSSPKKEIEDVQMLSSSESEDEAEETIPDDTPPLPDKKIKGTGENSWLIQSSLWLESVEDSLARRKKRSDQHYALLIKQLFTLLGEIQAQRTATGSDLTYLQVLALDNILTTLNISRTIEQSSFRIDMIVETLRSTASPQVHNSALLVINKIASFAPDAVLHSVMPLFTFMSSSTLRQADAYSVHVINMTIESMVPPLRESLKKRRKDLVAGASDLLLSFTAAFEHIPAHRRHDTFVQLLKVLGPDDALYAVLAMLVERYSEDNTLINTLRSIMVSFSTQTQLRALAQYLDITTDACKKRRGLSETILGFSEKNAAEANSSVATLLSGWANIVSNPAFRSKISSELRKDNAATVLEAYGALLEKLISLPHLPNNVVKFDEPSLKNTHASALQSLLALLPTEEFITSSASIMQAGSEQVRVQVFNSLTQRVKDAKTNNTRLVDIFIETLPNCSVFLTTSQPVSVRKATLACVDAICEKFGKRDRNAVFDVVKVVLGPAALLSDSPILQISSLLCLASSVEILGEEFISIAGQVLQVAVNLSVATIELASVNWQLVDASFTLLNTVLDHQAWLLDAKTLDRAVTLVCKVQQIDASKSWSAKQFYTLAPKQVAFLELCSSLDRTFDSITQLGSTAMLTRANMLHLAITSNTKAIITRNAELLSGLVFQSFALRAVISADDSLANQAYDVSIQSALDMTMKMNDLTFRPIYMRLVAWAENNDLKQIALYDFSHRLFQQLGSIVTTYASFILDDASAVLTGSQHSPHWSQLAITVLKALQASFNQDQDDFWTAPQHFDRVSKPVLGLLTQPFTTGSTAVSETIVELASSVSASTELLKVINTHIMTALRDQSAAIRLAAVKCQRKITETLTFDWLNLLPEMLPFISELLEDDDESVEREVLGWVAQIEEITGESLEGMLA